MYGLEILHKYGKRVETKGQKILGANSNVCRGYREKLTGDLSATAQPE